MQGVQPTQDENSGIEVRLPASKTFGSNIDSGVPSFEAKSVQKASTRKALGNITNRANQEQINLPPGSTVATSKKLGAGLRESDACTGPVASSSQAQELRVAKLASDGVEAPAGKMWDDLEADRQARMESEVWQNIDAFVGAPRLRIPNYYPSWGAHIKPGTGLATMEPDDDIPEPPSP